MFGMVFECRVFLTLRIPGWTLQSKGERTCMTQGCFWGPQNDAIFEGSGFLGHKKHLSTACLIYSICGGLDGLFSPIKLKINSHYGSMGRYIYLHVSQVGKPNQSHGSVMGLWILDTEHEFQQYPSSHNRGSENWDVSNSKLSFWYSYFPLPWLWEKEIGRVFLLEKHVK